MELQVHIVAPLVQCSRPMGAACGRRTARDALCELLKGHGIPLPGAVIAPHVKPNGLSAPTAMVPAEAAFEAGVVTPRA